MAEPAGGFDLRRLILVGGVMLVVLFSVLFFVFRSCAPALSESAARKPGYTVIYSNLDLKDAANVIARLKESNLPYEIRDDGRAIAVPKEKADQARLSLAEKNLPVGGSVGWEIFNESKLGATDFDRRIQLIRAISGELARMIRRINGVEEATVQVVIPETKLFAATTAPVTAAVMLRLRPGFMLAPEKINGIVHLVASSVENLQLENVTVVDDTGRILTGKMAALTTRLAASPPPPAERPVEIKEPEPLPPSPDVVMRRPVAIATVEVSKTAKPVTVEAVLTRPATLTATEKLKIKIQTKKELEQELAGKAQELLNRFYPLNSVIVRVTADFKPAKENELRNKELQIKKITTVILVDNRVDFNANLKQATFTTVAAAVNYHKKRGDRIILQRVPFHLATPPLSQAKGVTGQAVRQPGRALQLWGTLLTAQRLIGAGIAFVLLVLVFWFFTGRSRRPEPLGAPPVQERENVSKLDQVRNAVVQDPEKIAALLKKWLSE
ncbi:MAG: flagellar M-ring protein FliF [Candidatus Margulisbacteria bacterium]|jgi:flagellar M-ring protein FliF|nr:flagellar M-ring protein FliF [Candidatus Margulisiibacteriota bacterium]